MCLYVETDTLDIKPTRLSKDMGVYKVLLKTKEGLLVSPYRLAPYELGKVVRSRLDKPFWQWSNHRDVAAINKGLHGFLSLEDAKASHLFGHPHDDGLFKVFRGRIPKGSSAYFGTFEGDEPSFAATRLIIDAEVV